MLGPERLEFGHVWSRQGRGGEEFDGLGLKVGGGGDDDVWVQIDIEAADALPKPGDGEIGQIGLGDDVLGGGNGAVRDDNEAI